MHYRSAKAKEKYKILKSSEFDRELTIFENYIKEYWNVDTCEKFALSVRTNSVESYFATRLFCAPKTLKFPKNYRSRLACCRLSWNSTHISEAYKIRFGEDGVEKRKSWSQNIHARIFEKHPICDWVETRGRKRKFEDI